MQNLTPELHLSAVERAILASLTAREQLARTRVDASTAQRAAPGPADLRAPRPPTA